MAKNHGRKLASRERGACAIIDRVKKLRIR